MSYDDRRRNVLENNDDSDSPMSLDDHRRRVLSNEVDEEQVEVNQRLLIDKILARYSAEFVVYRELLQNSDDAGSSSVQIIFETANNKYKAVPNPLNPSKRLSLEDNKMEDKVIRITYKNNGFAFRLEDWNRLKKIAEGNPDEQKIGAFGVGFYSLFSVCEEPFVTSGGQGMAFFWRGNKLFTKQGPTDDKDKVWTSFLMDMREPLEFPNVEKFARFLANALGFTGNLKEVSVYFNNTLVIQLSKKMQEPKSIEISSEFDTFSPQKIFRLTSVDIRDVQLDVERLIVPTNFSSDHTQTEKASIFLKIASGNMDVQVSNGFSSEMERITKKKPPNKTNIQMIFTGFDKHEYYNKNVSSAFKDLLPYPEQGRIYIGFSTHQTTG
ncbi:histidine kinase-like ATPase, partial [Glomus cerebriforme]